MVAIGRCSDGADEDCYDGIESGERLATGWGVFDPADAKGGRATRGSDGGLHVSVSQSSVR